jgi:hypothetical protein
MDEFEYKITNLVITIYLFKKCPTIWINCHWDISYWLIERPPSRSVGPCDIFASSIFRSTVVWTKMKSTINLYESSWTRVRGFLLYTPIMFAAVISRAREEVEGNKQHTIIWIYNYNSSLELYPVGFRCSSALNACSGSAPALTFHLRFNFQKVTPRRKTSNLIEFNGLLNAIEVKYHREAEH